MIFCSPGKVGHFGFCAPGVLDCLVVFLTDVTNTLIIPAPPVFFRGNSDGYYRVNGHKTFATTLALSTGRSAFQLKAGQELRVWHG